MSNNATAPRGCIVVNVRSPSGVAPRIRSGRDDIVVRVCQRVLAPNAHSRPSPVHRGPLPHRRPFGAGEALVALRGRLPTHPCAHQPAALAIAIRFVQHGVDSPRLIAKPFSQRDPRPNALSRSRTTADNCRGSTRRGSCAEADCGHEQRSRLPALTGLGLK